MAKKEAETPVEPTEPAESAPSTPTEQPTVDPVVPAPEADPAPAAPAPETTNVKKKGGALKIILIVALVIIVIAGGTIGYGFYNGSRVKAYAKDSEKMINETKNWDKDLDSNSSTDMASIKTDLEKAKSLCNANLAKLNSMTAPGKVKDLEKNLKEYYTSVRGVADDVLVYYDWFAEIEKVSKNFTSLSSTNISSSEQMVTQLEKARDDARASVVKLNAMQAPDKMKEQHKIVVDATEEAVVMFDKMIPALKANDMAALMALGSSWSTSSLEKIGKAEEADKTADIFNEDIKKIDNLESTIYTEIGKLKNVTFSF